MTSIVQRFSLTRPGIHFPVTCLRGAVDDARTEVDAWLYLCGETRIGLIADSPLNLGTSVTNGFEGYADAVCVNARAVSYALADIRWYEFDSLGRFDEVKLRHGEIQFIPVKEGGHPPSSKEAFLARLWLTAPENMLCWQRIVNLLTEPYEQQARSH